MSLRAGKQVFGINTSLGTFRKIVYKIKKFIREEKDSL